MYRESTSFCKLVDVVHRALTASSIMLKPLQDIVRPPKFPNFDLRARKLDDDEETTDESDREEYDARGVVGGGCVPSPQLHLEYFLNRVSTLLWIACIIIVMLIALVRTSVMNGEDAPTRATELCVFPVMALIGLVPINAFVVNRIMVLLANAHVHILFTKLSRVTRVLSPEVDDDHDEQHHNHQGHQRELPIVSLREKLSVTRQILFGGGTGELRGDDGEGSEGTSFVPPRPLCLAKSTVEILGMATVLASLDCKGVHTDMTLLPTVLLILNAHTVPSTSTSTSDAEDGPGRSSIVIGGDDESVGGTALHAGVAAILTPLSQPAPTPRQSMHKDDGQQLAVAGSPGDEVARKKRQRIKSQILRKKFQEERFTELRFIPCTTDDQLAVELQSSTGGGVNPQQHAAGLNPISLCCLIHARSVIAYEQKQHAVDETSFTTPESRAMRGKLGSVDRTVIWGRALHWLPRCTNFKDNAADGFETLARIYTIDTTLRPHAGRGYPHFTCSILSRDATNLQLHLFTIGTPAAVVRSCESYWAGDSIDVFDDHQREEVLFIPHEKWCSESIETVACSHRLLPERYRKYVEGMSKRTRSGGIVEYFYVDGELVLNSDPAQPEMPPTDKGRGETESSMQAEIRVDEHDNGTADRKLPAPTRMQRSASKKRSSSQPGRSGASAEAVFDRPTHHKRVNSFGDHPRGGHGGAIELDSSISTQNFMTLMLACSHTLLGLVGLRDTLRPHVQSCVNLLDNAGIRFMHFGSGGEVSTKAFGARVGLEVDWNCCISLKAKVAALDPHSIRAQLPFGIKSIRKHLLFVDPIPLQVSLFSHSHSSSVRSMISILQDNHETVLVMGSTLNHGNVRSFVQADLAVGVLPTRSGPAAEKERFLHRPSVPDVCDFSDPLNPLASSLRDISELVGSSCSMQAQRTVNALPIVVILIRESRRLLRQMETSLEFILNANGLVVSFQCLALACGLPSLLSATTVLFVLNVYVPLLSLACASTAQFQQAGASLLTTMPSKHNFTVRCGIYLHSVRLFFLRYTLTIIMLLAASCWLLASMCNMPLNSIFLNAQLNGRSLVGSAGDLGSTPCVESSSLGTALLLGLFLVFHSLAHVRRHESVKLPFNLSVALVKATPAAAKTMFFSLSQCAYWGCVATVSGGTYLTFLALAKSGWSDLATRCFSSAAALVAGFIVVALELCSLLVLDVLIKAWRQRRYTNQQKFRQLFFQTRLGMHSPQGDYEPSTEDGGSADGANADHAAQNGAGSAGGFSWLDGARKAAHLFAFHFTTMRQGILERNCVCCEHADGTPAATYRR